MVASGDTDPTNHFPIQFIVGFWNKFGGRAAELCGNNDSCPRGRKQNVVIQRIEDISTRFLSLQFA